MCFGGQPDTPDPDPLPPAPLPPPTPPRLPLPSVRPSQQAEDGNPRLSIGRRKPKPKDKPAPGSLRSLLTPLNQPVVAQPQGINNPKPNP